MSDIKTLCSVCGKPADHVCVLCGRQVCSEHYDHKHRICTSCKKGKMVS